MASGSYLDTARETAAPSKHWIVEHKRAILAVIGLLLAGLVVFEYIHWLNSGMAFWDHMGHLREHIWSLITTGNWNPEEHGADRPMGAWLWGRRPLVRWG